MARQEDHAPPLTGERIAAVGEALDAAFAIKTDAVPEPMVRLMLELSREPRPAGDTTPVTIVEKRPGAAFARLPRWITALTRGHRKG